MNRFIIIVFILYSSIILNFINCQVINSIQYYSGQAQINGDKLLVATSWKVEPFFNGSTQPNSISLSVLSSTDSKVIVLLNNSVAIPGLIKGCVQTTCATNFWNPIVISNVSSVPTEGGVLTVYGNYLQQNPQTPNVLIFQNQQIHQNYSNSDGTEIHFPFPTNISQLDAGQNVSIVVNIRNTGTNAIFSYKKPIIESINIFNDTLFINGDSFGSSLSIINITINNNIKVQPNSFIQQHFNISLDIDSNKNLSTLFAKPGINQYMVDVKNNPSLLFNYTTKPIIDLSTNIENSGGQITIYGNHLLITNSSKSSVLIDGYIPCSNITNPKLDGKIITCTVPPNKNTSITDQLLPVVVYIDGFESLPSNTFSYSKEILVSSSESNPNSNNNTITPTVSPVIKNSTTNETQSPIIVQPIPMIIDDDNRENSIKRKPLWIIAPVMVGLIAIVGIVLLLVYHKRKLIKRQNEKPLDELPPGWDSKEDVEVGGVVLCYDEKIDARRLKAGRLESIVRHITYSKLANKDVIKCFLLSFRSYATRMEILDLLIECYDGSKKKNVIQPLPTNDEVHQRIGFIAQQWLEDHQYDFSDSPALSEKMTKFIQKRLKRDCPEIFQRILVLLSPAPSLVGTMVQLPIEIEAAPVTAKIENIDILDLDPAEIARQLTLLEAINHMALDDKEFFHLAPSHERILYRIPNLLTLTSQFTAISNWVTSEVMIKQQLDSRTKVIEKFIQVAKHLREIHNFNGCFEILDGLKYHSVQFLAKTWAKVDFNLINDYQELCQLFTEEFDYGPYREHLQNFINQQCIPFGKLIKLDIGKKLTLDQKQAIYYGDNNVKMINFDFYMEIWRLIQDFKCFDCNYPYVIDINTQNYIKNYKSLSKSDYDKLSISLER